MDVAIFGAGCFWGVEEAFRQEPGVTSTAVGYAGGTIADPSYEQVCSGETGHAEVVRVEYDPAEIGYERLLEIFWSIHDPTQKDRQGADVGNQYRSAIFYHTPEQEAAARASVKGLESSERFRGPIATEISPACAFHRAEEYHQQYLVKNGRAACPTSMRRD